MYVANVLRGVPPRSRGRGETRDPSMFPKRRPPPRAASPTLEETQRVTAALAGRYAIERELGRGEMATVYPAKDLKHDR